MLDSCAPSTVPRSRASRDRARVLGHTLGRQRFGHDVVASILLDSGRATLVVRAVRATQIVSGGRGARPDHVRLVLDDRVGQGVLVVTTTTDDDNDTTPQQNTGAATSIFQSGHGSSARVVRVTRHPAHKVPARVLLARYGRPCCRIE